MTCLLYVNCCWNRLPGQDSNLRTLRCTSQRKTAARLGPPSGPVKREPCDLSPLQTGLTCPPLNRSSAYVRLGRKLRGRTQTGSRLEWLGGGKAFDFKK